MAGLPPGDPQLVAMIVNHLKTQGLFDQFRRDCLADVDTKPAYLHLRQRVDNFVSNHLSNHTWSPQLNKNQLRNSIRQLVLQSGLLEQGVDRIVAQVVDPKVQHTFRPQVERVVRQFLSPGNHLEEEEPAMLLDNQEAQPLSPAPDPAPSQSHDPAFTKPHNGGEEDMNLVEDDEEEAEKANEDEEEPEDKLGGNAHDEISKEREKEEDSDNDMETEEAEQTEEPEKTKQEEEERVEDDVEEKEKKEEKGKDKKVSGRTREESSTDKLHIQQKARERLKEEYSLEDSDLDGLSDITVSSVHTSDLSSFDDGSEDDELPSDSTEEGEITSEDENVQKKLTGEESDENKEKKPRGSRQGYIHKPFLYSRYYSDSDDEVTVEQRRRSAAKDKEERLLKRQQNRERLEEKRRQKAAQAELQEKEKQAVQRPQAKEARKEKKVLEKKVALSRKRKRDSWKENDSSMKKRSDGDPDTVKKDDATRSKALPQKPVRKLSEEEMRRRKSMSEDSSEPRKIPDKNRTHSFILDLEHGTEDALRQRGGGKLERHARREKERKENEKERCVPDDRARSKQKPESKKVGEVAAEKGAVDDKPENKGSKVKIDKKSTVPAREGRLSVTDVSTPEDGMAKELKKEKTTSETTKDKIKGEKLLGKTDLKQQHRVDSTGSTEERSEGEGTSDFNRKKDKLKRSKSYPEVKSLEKVKLRQEGKDVGGGSKDKISTSENPKHGLETKVKNSEAVPKVKSVSEKARSKSRDELKSLLVSKTDKKAQEATGKVVGAAPSKMEVFKEKKKKGVIKEERRGSEDQVEKGKSTKKTSEKKTKEVEKEERDSDSERRISEADDLSSSSIPSALAEVVQSEGESASQPSSTRLISQQASLTTSDFPAQQVSESSSESYPKTSLVLDSLTEAHVSTPQGMDVTAESDSTDPSISESDLTSNSQAMDTVSDMAAVKATGGESNLTGPESMDTESETLAQQAIDAGSDHVSSPTTASKYDLASPNTPTESSDELQSQPTESNLTAPPPPSSELTSVSNLSVCQSSCSPPNSSEPNITATEPSDVKLNTNPALPRSSDSIPASNLTAPDSSDSFPASDLTDAQPSMSDLTVSLDSDIVPNPIPADTNSTSLPDDMYDALSDITPDPDDDEAAMRLAESQPQPCHIPAEADALLSLMDVCASAAVIDCAKEPDRHEAECSFRDADIKMKEAALTLLSMDPDQAVSPCFITDDAHIAEMPVESSASDLEDVATSEGPSKEVANESESESSERESEAPAITDFETKTSAPAFKEKATAEYVQINDAESQSEANSDDCKSDISAIDEPAVESAKLDATCICTHTADGSTNETENTAQEAQVQETEVQEAPVQDAVVQEAPVLEAVVQEAPVLEAVVQEAPVLEAVVQEAPIQEAVAQEAPEHEAVAQEAPEHEAVAQDAPVQEAVFQEAPVQESEIQEAPVQEAVVQEAEMQDVPVQEAEVQEAPLQEAPKVEMKEANAPAQEDQMQEQEPNPQEPVRNAQEQEAQIQDIQAQETPTHEQNAQETQEEQGTQALEVLKVQDSQTDETGAQETPVAQTPESKTQEVQTGGVPPQKNPPQPARRGRPPKLVKQASNASKSDGHEDKSDVSEADERVTRKGRWSSQRSASAKETAKPALKRKRSDQAEDPDKGEDEEEPAKRARKDRESVTEEEEYRESSKEKAEEVEVVKKVPRRGRPSKTIPIVDDSAPEKKEGETGAGEEDEEETKIRATTRSASRLEAEKNKPSKPSTRAVSKLSGKEDSSPHTRSSRLQSAAAVKSRKGDSSSPTPRTRVGQKPEEPPIKRTKR